MQDFIKSIDSTTIAAIIGAIGALIAAGVAVIGTLIVTHLTKKQRLSVEVKSRHRQEWINSLRKDISLICTKSNYIAYDIREILQIDHTQRPDNTKTFSEYILENSIITTAYFNVKLFLNPKEIDHINIDNKITELQGYLKDFINENFKSDSQLSSNILLKKRKRIDTKINEITTLSQKIFKDEWERIKKGN
ncbi:TPA: hypothetical protein ACH7H9_004524 [Escherichia coli]|nr:hypothetical protein [Escherichia coli]